MRTAWLSLLLAAFASAAAAAVPGGRVDTPLDTRLDAFRRGVNLSHWYAQTIVEYGEAVLSTYFTEADARRISSMGFDHVRLTFAHAELFGGERGDELDTAAWARFEPRLATLLDVGLNVVFDVHPDDGYKQAMLAGDGPNRLVAQWRELARRLSGTDPDRVLLEVMNEPYPVEADDWRPLQLRVVEAIRGEAPLHTIIVSAGGWTGYDSLPGFQPYELPNLVYTFHYYEPHVYTHQAAGWGWDVAQRVAGLTWPIDPPDAEVVTRQTTSDAEAAGHVQYQIGHGWFTPGHVRRHADAVADWQAEHGVPVYVGEFGVFRYKAEPQGRYRWHEAVRREFESRGWGWAVWDYSGGFAVVDGDDRVPDRRMMKALGLTGNDAPQVE